MCLFLPSLHPSEYGVQKYVFFETVCLSNVRVLLRIHGTFCTSKDLTDRYWGAVSVMWTVDSAIKWTESKEKMTTAVQVVILYVSFLAVGELNTLCLYTTPSSTERWVKHCDQLYHSAWCHCIHLKSHYIQGPVTMWKTRRSALELKQMAVSVLRRFLLCKILMVLKPVCVSGTEATDRNPMGLPYLLQAIIFSCSCISFQPSFAFVHICELWDTFPVLCCMQIMMCSEV